INSLYVLSVVAIVGMGAAIAFTRPLELGLLAAIGLGFDALVIGLINRLFLIDAASSIPGMLLIGILSAAIVAVTGREILRFARAQQTAASTASPADVQAVDAGSGVQDSAMQGAAWPVILMTSI